MSPRRLERSTTNRVVSGVCGGVAEYFALDATLVRAFFVICTILTAFVFVLVYIALLILMPLPGHRAPIDDVWPGASTTPAEPGAPAPLDPHDADRRRNTAGYVLIALGFVFLIGNMGAFRFFRWDILWPVVIVAVGVLLVVQRARS